MCVCACVLECDNTLTFVEGSETLLVLEIYIFFKTVKPNHFCIPMAPRPSIPKTKT
jgi:hypothetical protein